MKLACLPLALIGGTLLAQTPGSSWTQAAPAVAAKFERTIVARPDTEESMLTVSPDGTQLFWGVSRLWFPATRVSEIWTAKREGAAWSAPARAQFSIGFSDGDPFVSYDGKRLYFVSMRPAPAPRKDFDIYVVDRTDQGFGRPRNLESVNSPGDELYPSVAADGTIYFGSERSGTWKIYRAKPLADGKYAEPVALPEPVNVPDVWAFNPFITADGKTLLFTSLNRKGGTGKGDIYVATKGPSGEFTTARNLGPKVNTAEEEFHPTMSPDGKALFFIRRNTSAPGGNADVYWLSTSAVPLKG